MAMRLLNGSRCTKNVAIGCGVLLTCVATLGSAATSASESIGGVTTSADSAPHWAFRPPQAQLPSLRHQSDWPRNEIDLFILSSLEQAGLTPSGEATLRVLLRRVYYDLIGLPPSADELDAFAAAASSTEYERVVDQLLASPHFGERWARHWLDIARYADTKGYLFTEDRNYPHAYKYRDWVIESFNSDLPYDQFLLAQLAADQLDDPAATAAVGFLTLGRRFLNNVHDIADDRIDLITRGLMGLTVSCARCHDHKYDPISTADYYALYGVLASSREVTREDGPPLLVDAEQPVEPVVFLRGNPAQHGPQVPRRFLPCLSAAPPEPFQQGSGRLELAKAIASDDNPLTARVWVNRVWSHLCGRGLVGTPSNFGKRGEPPSHPELLDWLACRFMDEGWSTKRLIRQIVLSSAYRQTSAVRSEVTRLDPENRLLAHMNRRRLDLEACRDSLLLAAGRLDRSVGGPSVPLTEEPFATRRAIYGHIERQNLPSYFRTFDFANPNTHTPARPHTVSPQQALYFLNSPFVMEQACALAARCGGATDEHRITELYRYALGRSPSKEELAGARSFVGQEYPAKADPRAATSHGGEATSNDPLDRWEQLAQVLLMCNEFSFID